jgi:hypothetical protein
VVQIKNVEKATQVTKTTKISPLETFPLMTNKIYKDLLTIKFRTTTLETCINVYCVENNMPKCLLKILDLNIV